MRLGLDFDGVIANDEEVKTLGIRELCGIDVDPADLRSSVMLEKGILTREQYYDEFHPLIYNTDFLFRTKPVKGAVECIGQLLAEGHDVRVITARRDVALETARLWSETHGLHLPFTGVGWKESKASAATGLDFFVDDSAEVLEHLVGIVPNLCMFLWANNRNDSVSSSVTRVDSWNALYRVIQDIAGNSQVLR